MEAAPGTPIAAASTAGMRRNVSYRSITILRSAAQAKYRIGTIKAIPLPAWEWQITAMAGSVSSDQQAHWWARCWRGVLYPVDDYSDSTLNSSSSTGRPSELLIETSHVPRPTKHFQSHSGATAVVFAEANTKATVVGNPALFEGLHCAPFTALTM